MTELILFGSFFLIGLVSFGGGYAMIPLMQKMLEDQNWLSRGEFVDIIAVAQMTPGPVAVNTGTYIGYRVGGVAGSIAATVGVILPSFLLVVFLSSLFFNNREHPLFQMMLLTLKAVVTGLIAGAVFFVALSVWPVSRLTDFPYMLKTGALTLFSFGFLLRSRRHPVWLILIAGAVGIGIF